MQNAKQGECAAGENHLTSEQPGEGSAGAENVGGAELEGS